MGDGPEQGGGHGGETAGKGEGVNKGERVCAGDALDLPLWISS